MRIVVLLLLLANSVYFAWSEGHLSGLGFAPYSQREPERMAAQIKPESMRILSAQDVRRLEAAALPAATKPSECLQSALLTPAQLANMPRITQELKSSRWLLADVPQNARWIVYMGKYANAEAVAKKKSELRQLSVAFETLRNPALEPGLALGGYSSQALAEQELANLAKRGVRTARAVLESPVSKGQVLRIPAVDDAVRSALPALKELLGGKALVACSA